MQIAEDLLKMHLKGLEMSVRKSNYHFASLWVGFFLSTSLKLPALLEEVRRSPSFVEEDFRLLWKIARHLELSERVRDLSFNFPLSSLPCCTTPSTSQCGCLACLYACCLFVYLFFPSQSNGMEFFSTELGSCLQDILDQFSCLSQLYEHNMLLLWFNSNHKSEILTFKSCDLFLRFDNEIDVELAEVMHLLGKSLPAGKSFVLQPESPQEY